MVTNDEKKDVSPTAEWNRPYASYVLCPLLLVLVLMPWGLQTNRSDRPTNQENLAHARAGLLPLCTGVLFAWLVEITVGLQLGEYIGVEWIGVDIALVVSHVLPFLFALFLWRPALSACEWNALTIGSLVAIGVGSLVMLGYLALGVPWPYDASTHCVAAGYMMGVAVALMLGQYYPSPRTGQGSVVDMNFDLEKLQPIIPASSSLKVI